MLVIGHVMAIALPPLAFQSRGSDGSSPSVTTALAPVRHYAEFIYADRGYAFFAPDPGPSHLIQAVIEPGSDQEQTIFLPSHSLHWPRLLYHRHFMLAEFLNANYRPAPPQQSDDLQSDEQQIDEPGVEIVPSPLDSERQRFLRVWQSIDRHLADVYRNQDGSPATVASRRVEHALPIYAAYMDEPIELDDPRLYRVLLDGPVPPPGIDSDSGGTILPDQTQPVNDRGPAMDRLEGNHSVPSRN